MRNLLIPTKDNPHLLSACLASIISSAGPNRKDTITLWLMDASHIDPSPQLKRLLPFFKEVKYYSFRGLACDVNAQRIQALSLMEGPVLCLDDDIVVLGDYVDHWFSTIDGAHSKTPQLPVFGVTVDMTNEREYADYHWFTDDPSDNHGFCAVTKMEMSQSVEDFTASPGHIIVDSKFYLDALNMASRMTANPAVADDAAATFLARTHKGAVHSGLRSIHLGNDNPWYEPIPDKHDQVNAVVERMMRQKGAH